MEPIDHIGQSDGQADIDNLFGAEVAGKIAVSHVIYWFKSSRLLRIANNCRLVV